MPPNAALTNRTADLPEPSSTSSNGYKDIAEALPHPNAVLDIEPAPHRTTATQHQFTIPGDHVEPDNIPYNSDTAKWRSWRSKFTTITALYVLAARHSENDASDRRAIHAVFSPPQSDVTSHDSVQYWRAKATEIAEQHGMRAGVAAFHGYRIKKPVSEQFQSYIYNTRYADTATNVLLWEWIRRGDWRDYVEWGPHFHLMGLCNDLTDYDGNGILHRLRTFEPYDRTINTTAVAEHRAVAKDTIDHLTFNRFDPAPPLSWFGDLEGTSWSSAEQLATDTTIENLRDELIQGPPTDPHAPRAPSPQTIAPP